jgi:hypothetical protein
MSLYLCIGGPIDGQRLVTDRPYWDVMERPELVPAVPRYGEIPAFEVRRHRYRGYEVRGVHLMVHDRLSLDSALEALVHHYPQENPR